MNVDRAEIDELLADIRQATEQARATAAQQQQDRAEFARESHELDQERAEAARRGEHGRDWQEIQGRIDRGQTTLAKVLSGEDDSPAAQRIQETAAQNLATITAEIAEHDQATGGERFSVLNEAFTDLRASMQRAADAAERARDLHRPE
ncbi:MAG TPA: hypothetical protein VK063_00100 [Beutenbergiaceae bacterium]|nr:hypothetical protein [Beutenbergiaceae bacterium]